MSIQVQCQTTLWETVILWSPEHPLTTKWKKKFDKWLKSNPEHNVDTCGDEISEADDEDNNPDVEHFDPYEDDQIESDAYWSP